MSISYESEIMGWERIRHRAVPYKLYSVITTNQEFELGTFQMWQFTTFYHLNGQPGSNFTLSNFGLIAHDVLFFMDYTITYNIYKLLNQLFALVSFCSKNFLF